MPSSGVRNAAETMTAPDRRFAEAWPDLIDLLRSHYDEAHRAYHTWDHITALLGHFEGLEWHDPASVEVALYWHDVIYEPLSATNEADSAALMHKQMTGRADGALLERADAIILATATHRVPTTADAALAQDCELFLDMDLSILGAPWDEFAKYDQAIRQEFIAIPDPVFLPRRRAVMAGFLERERLFLTDTFHRRYDAQARANLTRLVASLPES